MEADVPNLYGGPFVAAWREREGPGVVAAWIDVEAQSPREDVDGLCATIVGVAGGRHALGDEQASAAEIGDRMEEVREAGGIAFR